MAPEVLPAASPDCAGWLTDRLRPWGNEGTTVDSIVPAGYDAFARILKLEGDDLSQAQALRLATVLSGKDPLATVYFALWEGYGIPGEPGAAVGDAWAVVPRIELPGRTYLLFQGRATDIVTFDWQGYYLIPDIWWPDHRRWCVGSDPDLAHVYVGGSGEAVAELIQTDVEAELIAANTRLDLDPRAGV